MNVNASPDTIRAASAALGRASLFDDRITDSDAGRISAWAEALEDFKFDQADLLAAVTKHYQAQDAPTIRVGDLIASAREIRRVRGLKQNADEILSAPAITPPDGQLGGLPIAGADGPPIAAAYAVNGAIDRQCPRCKSAAGQACWNPSSRKDRKIPCAARLRGKAA